jgi:uncharacterized membrane protein
MVIVVNRYFCNLTTTQFALKRAFPERVLDSIEQAVRKAESQHGGEIQFAVETALGIGQLLAGVSVRDEALQAFADLHVWDTENNCGVLIYILLSERAIEIVADRGYVGHVAEVDWRAVCVDMERQFANDNFLEGSLTGIEAVSALISTHFPLDPNDNDERPNRPVML